MQGFFHRWIGETKPHLHEVNPQHRGSRKPRSPRLALGRIRLDQRQSAHGTTYSISSRSSRLRVRLVTSSNPVAGLRSHANIIAHNPATSNQSATKSGAARAHSTGTAGRFCILFFGRNRRIGNPTGLREVWFTPGVAANRRFWTGMSHDSQEIASGRVEAVMTSIYSANSSHSPDPHDARTIEIG